MKSDRLFDAMLALVAATTLRGLQQTSDLILKERTLPAIWPSTCYMRSMTDEPENLTLRYLRKFDEKLDPMAIDMRDVKGRLTNVEIVLGALATAHGQMQQSMDRLSDRMERIERRLEL